jgi:type 1 glutamine amidotransferase/HEAT repeat protein
MTHSGLFARAALLLMAAGVVPARAQISQDEATRIREAAPSVSTVKPRQPRLLLVFNLSEGYKHSAIPHASQALEILGKKTGAYQTVQSDDPSVFRPENLQRFDAVVLNNTTQLKFEDPAWRKSLMDFVAGGKGIVGIHAATDNFPTWPEGQELLGGVFDGHPWGADGTWAVKNEDPAHPLNAGFGGKGFLIRDEIYRVRQIDLRKNSRVLLGLDMTADRNRRASGVRPTDRDIPISWVRAYGKGRLFYCSLGHNDDVYTNPAVLRHYLDGIQFALGDYPAVMTPVPFDPMRMFDQERLTLLLRGVAAYQYGESRAALSGLNEFIRSLEDIPEARARMEKQFLELLGGSATPAGKQFICSRLALIGSEESIPRLTALLNDTATADMGLLALEPIPGPAVDAALRQALIVTQGRTKVGVITALGNRRVEAATEELRALASDPDLRVSGAAVSALAMIGTPSALAALEQAAGKQGERNNLLDAMLRCADRLRDQGDREGALAVYRKLGSPGKPVPIRCAALRGEVLSDPGNSGALLLAALRSEEAGLRVTAAREVRSLPGIGDRRVTARSLPGLQPATQVALLASLTGTPDAEVEKIVLAAASSANPEVRWAALQTLGSIGNASTVLPLARIAARTTGAEQKEARTSLYALHAQGVDDSLQGSIPSVDPRLKAELIRAVGERRVESAVPLLLQAARDPSASVRLESAKALKVVAAGEHVPAMVELLVRARDDASRKELEIAVAAAARRIPETSRQDEAVLAAYQQATEKKTRVTLINVLGKIGAPASLPVLRTSLTDREPDIRLAGIRALSAWPTPEPYADLWPMAREAKDPAQRILALRGSVRLIGLDSTRAPAETVERYQEAMRVAPNAAERKTLLSAVGEAHSVAALEMAAGYLGDRDLQLEAEAAALNIAESIADTARRESVPQLERIATSSANGTNVDRAKALIRKIEIFDDYITNWEYAGPYQEPWARLLDEPFGPELSLAPSLHWKPLHAVTDPKRPWLLQLEKSFDGEDQVVYIRTNVWSPGDQKVRLEVGTDYGIKGWLNGRLVHESNSVRRVTPGDDRVPIMLTKGWNTLMMKFEQGDGAWGACARVRNSDGGKLDGIRVSIIQD